MGKKKITFTVSSGDLYVDLGRRVRELYDGHTIVYDHGPTSWSAYVEDLPVCFAAAPTREECVRLIHEALPLHVAALEREAVRDAIARAADKHEAGLRYLSDI